MRQAAAATRMTIGLAGLASLVILVAQTFGLVPHHDDALIESRRALCEAFAIHYSLLAEQNDLSQIESSLQATIDRDPDIVAARLRDNSGAVLFDIAGTHQTEKARSSHATKQNQASILLTSGGQRWGTLEIQFKSLGVVGVPLWQRPTVQLVLFTGLLSGGIYFLYLRGMLQYFDPSQVVPDRVRSAFDTLAEGVLVLDTNERIVLANEAFARTVGKTSAQLAGSHVSTLPWVWEDAEDKPADLPWTRALAEGKPQTGIVLGLEIGGGEGRKLFRVNSSPIFSETGRQRGALASFDDVTVIERNRAELRRMLQVLEDSRDEISRQNEELQVLATQDPLTHCLNRRSFFTAFESHWTYAEQHQEVLSCVMVDVDNFKLINDESGHAVGDQVLKRVAEILSQGRRETDLVCRYGGEEFCILLPQADIDFARHVADNMRQAICVERIESLAVTASFGVSANTLGARDPHELLNQADRALYAAKRNGRNQVVRWDDVPEDLEIDEAKLTPARPLGGGDAETAIPFHAVTALVSALAYRDSTTAEHSRRVADLCVAAANGLMSVGEAYILEIAALLHDIGKIGVPDAVLLKPGPLNEEEWKLMSVHDRVGVEIICSTFACKKLARIVQTRHAWFSGVKPGLELQGEEIPLAARLLAIADAYDSMVSDRVYRQGRTQEEAFAELRRWANKQFDPVLVERFIETVRARDANRNLPLQTISKQTALQIGMEIERLAAALDEQDLFGLSVLAGRLEATATKEGILPIAEAAAQLVAATADDPDLREILQLTTELLELCRMTQRAYLHNGRPGMVPV